MSLQKLRENSRLVVMLFAICLALGAQYYFTGEIFTHQRNSHTWEWTTNFSLALTMLLLAIGFSAWAASSRDKTENVWIIEHGLTVSEPKGNRIWIIASGLSYLLSILIYLLVGENSLVRGLWVAGIGYLVVPLWLQSKSNSGKEDKVQTWEWIIVGAIFLIGFGLRYWKLTEIPSHVDNDVALMGTYGINLIETGNFNWIGYSASQHLLSYDQFLAWSMRLFGQDHYGIVMHSVVLGTLSLLLIFLLGREFGGPLTGLMAAGLLAISYTHIHFNRILFGNSASFTAIFVVYSILKGLRTRQSFWFALAGILIGWGVLLYDSSRVIPILILSIIAWQWLWHRQWLKSMYKDWMLLIAGILLGFGPMLAFAVMHFSEFAGRTNVVGLWTDVVWQHQLASYETDSPFIVLIQQIWRTFLTLHLTGDGSPHFSFQRPMVSPVSALFFVLGLGYALLRIKDIKYFTMLAWIFLTFILGSVLTADPPYWPHLNIALPAIFIVAAAGIESLAKILRKTFGRISYMVFIWVMAGILLVTGINNWQVYYDYVKNNAGNRIRIARYLNSLPSSYHVYLISDNFTWNEYAFRFFSREMNGQDLPLETLENAPPLIEQPTVFILFRHSEMAPILQRLYPNGALENHYDFENFVSFISYEVIPSTIDVTPDFLGVSQLSSSGWQLIFLFIVLWIGYVAYGYYSTQEAAVTQKRLTDEGWDSE